MLHGTCSCWKRHAEPICGRLTTQLTGNPTSGPHFRWVQAPGWLVPSPRRPAKRPRHSPETSRGFWKSVILAVACQRAWVALGPQPGLDIGLVCGPGGGTRYRTAHRKEESTVSGVRGYSRASRQDVLAPAHSTCHPPPRFVGSGSAVWYDLVNPASNSVYLLRCGFGRERRREQLLLLPTSCASR